MKKISNSICDEQDESFGAKRKGFVLVVAGREGNNSPWVAKNITKN